MASQPCLDCDCDSLNVHPQHPVVPLTCKEINAVVAQVKTLTTYTNIINPKWSKVQLVEPVKAEVYQVNSGQLSYNNTKRYAESIIYQPPTAQTYIFRSEIVWDTDPVQVINTALYKGPLNVIPAMDQYVFGLGDEWDEWDPDLNKDTVAKAVRENQELLDILLTRGVTKAMLENGSVRPDYIGGFESFRTTNTNDCDGCCEELVGADEPWYRYATIYFRFFAPDLSIGSATTGIFEKSVDPLFQTAVVNTSGTSSTGNTNNPQGTGGVGHGYYGSLARMEGLIVRVNVTTHQLLDIVDIGFEQAPTDVQVDKIFRPKHNFQSNIQPMIIDLPRGPSVKYNKNTGLIQFDNWSMRLSWDFQNGLQLYNITWSDTDINDGSQVDRTVLYKASFSEDTVSYSAGNPMFRRNFTSADAMFYPVGRRLIRLIKGLHVPCYAELVSFVWNGRDGEVDFGNSNVYMRDTLAMYEQDGDLTAIFTGANGPSARGRELVVRSIFSGLFYLWIFDWVFAQDGSIHSKTEVTGRLVVALRKGQPTSPWGDYVARNYLGITHNHIYCWRLDFDIDGIENELEIEEVVPANNCEDCKTNVECCSNILTRDAIDKCDDKCGCTAAITKCNPENSKVQCVKKDRYHKDNYKRRERRGRKCGKNKDIPCIDKVNPCGHGTFIRETEVETVKDAITNVSNSTNRSWIVKNHKSTLRFNNGGQTGNRVRGYAVETRAQGASAAQDWSWLLQNLTYCKFNFFATVYNPEQQYASGTFPILQKGDQGLGAYIAENPDRSLVDQDIVVWYTVPLAHATHTEDWPYITLEPQEVALIPHNFFEWNPATTINTQNEDGSIGPGVIYNNVGYYGPNFCNAVQNIDRAGYPNPVTPCGPESNNVCLDVVLPPKI